VKNKRWGRCQGACSTLNVKSEEISSGYAVATIILAHLPACGDFRTILGNFFPIFRHRFFQFTAEMSEHVLGAAVIVQEFGYNGRISRNEPSSELGSSRTVCATIDLSFHGLGTEVSCIFFSQWCSMAALNAWLATSNATQQPS
jgi:hypothetical protein